MGIQRTVTFRGTRADLMKVLRKLPQTVRTGARTFRVRLGLTVLKLVHQAFLLKSKGGTDQAGDRWKSLSPVTIRLRMRKVYKRLPRGKKYLTEAAEPILIESGDLEQSLKPSVPPAQATPYPVRMRLQVFRLERGSVTVGTRRKHAEDHHQGRPPKLPQRRLWPTPSRWPSSWRYTLAREAQAAMVDVIVNLLQGKP